MKLKWLIRIGILVLFGLLMYYGYLAQKRFEESKRPRSDYFHTDMVDKFEYDSHGHAYRDLDDSDTLYIDDPKLRKKTFLPTKKDTTLPKPLTVEDIRRPDEMPIDEFKVEGSVTRDSDYGDTAYPHDAYSGELPD